MTVWWYLLQRKLSVLSSYAILDKQEKADIGHLLFITTKAFSLEPHKGNPAKDLKFSVMGVYLFLLSVLHRPSRLRLLVLPVRLLNIESH
ncbi:hypothetical protein KDI_09630 [Dictyobacter arantiisoli]|uniref:Uncharacterized protein n=1 Tax=Dictyobacter arantiisoli TaxID=2014874 RepID=A0A5A5T8U0_9CHLR|nr:hypothetical protein KDI_09630 [Dictyobacter arantiisoli]